MRIAVLGAGSGGLSAVAELSQRGIATRLWNRSLDTLRPLQDAGGVRYEGVLGSGLARPECISSHLDEVLHGADGVLVCLPTLAHVAVANALADLKANDRPVVLNPGHTGGALEVREVFRQRGVKSPPIAEFSTLTYVARKSSSDCVWTTGAAKRVWVAALPGGAEALSLAQTLYPASALAPDVIVTGLNNVNMVLHPPGAILGSAWVESTAGDFTFYVQGLTACVGRVMELLDAERRAVARAYGYSLAGLFHEMQAIGTIEESADEARGLAAAIRSGEANKHIKAPNSLGHRYYTEDFDYGLRPFLVFASIAQVETPIASALMALAQALLPQHNQTEGRSARAMGIEDYDRVRFLKEVSS